MTQSTWPLQVWKLANVGDQSDDNPFELSYDEFSEAFARVALAAFTTGPSGKKHVSLCLQLALSLSLSLFRHLFLLLVRPPSLLQPLSFALQSPTEMQIEPESQGKRETEISTAVAHFFLAPLCRCSLVPPAVSSNHAG